MSGVVNFEVMIEIETDASVLRPDMTANVSIRTAEREALVLPNRAVQRDGFERYVMVRGETGLVRRSVSVGAREGPYTEIRQGVSAGEQVALFAAEG